MSSKEETRPPNQTSPATLNDGDEQTAIKTGKKPFVEPTISVSLNILDATAFFGGTPVLDIGDT